MATELIQLVFSGLTPQQIHPLLQQQRPAIESIDAAELDQLLVQIAAGAGDRVEDWASFCAAVQLLAHELMSVQEAAEGAPEPWSQQRLDSIGRIYAAVPAAADVRNHLLYWLLKCGGEEGMKRWADLMVSNPPEYRLGLTVAFAVLVEKDFEPPGWLSEKLLQATAHMQLAPLIFDTFNFWFREQKVDPHPAVPRSGPMLGLLGELVGQLGKIEEGQLPPGVTPEKFNLQVTDSISLVVSLCHMFGLSGNEKALPKLHQALGLKHRRIQTEAAAALAKLGDDDGKEALVQLAEEPVARLRVLHYAEELGILKDVSLEWQGEIATAESHLAIWLAEPAQIGFAPAEIRLVDNREMRWPSYEDAVSCYLFEYRYGLAEQAPGNIGICGPLTHAFQADLRALEVDDMYAAFAGWQTVHQEIFQTTLDKARQASPGVIASLEKKLAKNWAGGDDVFAASFFGEWMLVAHGEGGGEQGQGTVVVEADDVSWIPSGNANAPIEAETAYCIVKGRKLLAHFNAESHDAAE